MPATYKVTSRVRGWENIAISASDKPWGASIRQSGRRDMENDTWSRRMCELGSEVVVVTETDPSVPDGSLPVLVPGEGAGIAFLEIREPPE